MQPLYSGPTQQAEPLSCLNSSVYRARVALIIVFPFADSQLWDTFGGGKTTSKTFRTKRDADDWARRTEDEMVRGAYVQRASADRMTLADALKRYVAEITPTKRPMTHGCRKAARSDPAQAPWQVFACSNDTGDHRPFPR
jgi:hypothetical protein